MPQGPNRPSATTHSFESLIQPISFDTFVGEYWQKRHLHLRNRGEGFYRNLFTYADVDHYLELAARQPREHISLAKHGKGPTMRVSETTPRKLYQAVSEGWSIKLAEIDRCWPRASGPRWRVGKRSATGSARVRRSRSRTWASSVSARPRMARSPSGSVVPARSRRSCHARTSSRACRKRSSREPSTSRRNPRHLEARPTPVGAGLSAFCTFVES